MAKTAIQRTKTVTTKKASRGRAKKSQMTDRAILLREESRQHIRDKLSGVQLLNGIVNNYEEVELIQQEVDEVEGPIYNEVGRGRKVASIQDAYPVMSVKDQLDKCKMKLDCIKLKLDTNWKRLNKLLPDAKEIDEGQNKKNTAEDFISMMHKAMEEVDDA